MSVAAGTSDYPASQVKMQLRMPGCVLKAVSNDAEIFFTHEAGKSLRAAIEHEENPVLCTLLDAPSAYRRRYCGLEAEYDQVCTRGHAKPTIYAVRHSDEERSHREYRLFIAHARQAGANLMAVRFLPFPSTMRLRVCDYGGLSKASPISELTRLSEGLTIEAPPLLLRRTVTLAHLAKALLPEMEAAAEFYSALLRGLRDNDPRTAWGNAASRFPDIVDDIPPGITELCCKKNQPRSQEVEEDVRKHWLNPLDAPTFTQLIYPELLAALDNDHDLRYAPPAPLGDRDRYFRLHIPIDELEAQDRYLGWLPSEPPYRDDRELVRQNLNTQQ